jgi:D-beta-D-heptose 7-phosphate kinase/D-beta-D-heptose 1-phosphate adenosyltransferase
MLESLRFVDFVVVFDELRPTRIVRELMPQVIVKGGDFTPDQVRIVDEIPEGVEIRIFPVITDGANEKLSTTAIITKLST